MEFSDYAETRTLATDANGIIIPVSKGGVARSVNENTLNPFRGDYAGGTSMPSSGGRGASGAPKVGDMWRLTGVLTISGFVYDVDTVIMFVGTDPTLKTHWLFLAVQL